MVRGRVIAVTAVALMYQCALITRMARGRGTDWPKERQLDVYRLSSNAFIGLPCPMNAAGIAIAEPGSVISRILLRYCDAVRAHRPRLVVSGRSCPSGPRCGDRRRRESCCPA